MSSRPLVRVFAALVASVLAIYLLSIIKSGPSAAADFDCSSDPGETTVSIDVAAGETGLEIARELFEKDVVASSEVFFRLAVADPKASLIAPGVHGLTLKYVHRLPLTSYWIASELLDLSPYLKARG